MPRPAPASFVATRTASPTGSGPRGGVLTGARGLALAAPLRPALDAPLRPVLDAPLRPALDAFPRAAAPRPAPLAFFAVALVVRGFFPPLAPDALPPPAPPARLSLLRPGRERGRFPITPGSSVTAREYCGRLTIPCATCCEIRCFARERRDLRVYSCPGAGRAQSLPPLAPQRDISTR
jgi:hypothetical protein